MPKCLECGTTNKRLQWTHFVHKCTGRFKNGKEYRSAYPDAKLVDDDVAQSTGGTLKNYQKKHGMKEGQILWDQYRERQSHSNSLEYKQEKHGWSQEKYDNYNKSRSVTLPNMIAKHGDIEGSIKWQEYCERQAYTNTKAYFIERDGQEAGSLKYAEVCRKKSHSLDVVMERHGCDKETALEIVQGYTQSEKYSSNAEKEFVDCLTADMNTELEYQYKTKQYCIWANNRANFYDIVHNNKAIEFNGDYWHCNPQTYSDDWYHPQVEMTAGEIWDRDNRKVLALNEHRSIQTLVIWESEYLTDPTQTIKRCKEWLNSKDKKFQK